MYAPTLVDIHSILDARINGDVFLSLNESRLERSGVTLGFQLAIMSIIEDLVCDTHLNGSMCSYYTDLFPLYVL